MRTVCAGAGCLNTCIRLDPTFYSVTLSGITVQSIISSSVAGFNLCSGTTVTYTATPQYGVPPYTYSWNPGGGTTAAISVTPLVNSTYTLIVTDACGNTYFLSVQFPWTFLFTSFFSYYDPYYINNKYTLSLLLIFTITTNYTFLYTPEGTP